MNYDKATIFVFRSHCVTYYYEGNTAVDYYKCKTKEEAVERARQHTDNIQILKA